MRYMLLINSDKAGLQPHDLLLRPVPDRGGLRRLRLLPPAAEGLQRQRRRRPDAVPRRPDVAYRPALIFRSS
jgi:hypothetical protein